MAAVHAIGFVDGLDRGRLWRFYAGTIGMIFRLGLPPVPLAAGSRGGRRAVGRQWRAYGSGCRRMQAVPTGRSPSKAWENAGIGKKIGEKEGRRGKDAENLAFPIDKQAAAGYNICKGKRFTGPAAAGFLFVRFTFVRPR